MRRGSDAVKSGITHNQTQNLSQTHNTQNNSIAVEQFNTEKIQTPGVDFKKIQYKDGKIEFETVGLSKDKKSSDYHQALKFT